MTRLEHKLLDILRKADADFGLLEQPFLLGFSGGKDSWALHHLLTLGNISHQLVHVIPHKHDERDWIAWLEKRFGNQITIIQSDIFSLLKGNRKDCFTCSRQRRRLLFETAQQLKIHTIALAHHRQDVIETFFLNAFFSRELSTMLPRQSVFQGEYAVIRPLYYVDEADIERLHREQQFPIKDFACPVGEMSSRRRWIKDWLQQLQAENPQTDLIDNVFSALFHCNQAFLPQTKEREKC